MKKIAIGQAGGPTSVINTTLVGLIKETMAHYKLSFILNGYEGLVQEKMLEGTSKLIQQILQYEDIPGACLGAGRYPMTEIEILEAVKFLKKEEVHVLVFIGGDGTMEALHKIDKEAEKQGYDLQIIGLPKTVDNDINYTDHAPGFGSSAKYIAHTTRDLSYDLYSMRNFEQIRIIETMGRNAGWLAAASGFFKNYEEEGPHFIALPEHKISKENMLSSVDSAVTRFGYAIVVVSEGVIWNGGNQVGKDIVNGRAVLGGVSQEIERFIRKNINVKVRADILGMNQRCFSSLTSLVDKKEACFIGVKGGEWIKKGLSSVMVAIKREETPNYNIYTKPVLLKDVANAGERLMPDYFVKNLKDYYEWLSPIIDGKGVNYPRLITKQSLQNKMLG